MLSIHLDRTGGLTLAKQLEAGLTHMILSGVLKPEQKLPTVRDLARQLQVNRNTVQGVYKHLTDTGLLETRVGDGTYVVLRASVDDSGAQRRAHDIIRQALLDALGGGVLGVGELRGVVEYELAELTELQSRRAASEIRSKSRFAKLDRHRS